MDDETRVPYTRDHSSPQEIADMRQYLEKEGVYKKAEELSSPLLLIIMEVNYSSIKKTGKDLPNDIVDLLIKKFSNYKRLSLVQPGSHVYSFVQETLGEYNAAHPQANLQMPRLIFESDKLISPAYIGADALILSKPLYQLGNQFNKGSINHEFGHKDQLENSQPVTISFSSEKMAAIYSPDLYAACKSAGLTDPEIKELLPSDKFSFLLSPTLIEHEYKAAEILHYGDADTAADIVTKAHSTPACEKSLNTVKSHIPEALRITLKEEAKNNRLQELTADTKAADVIGKAAMYDKLVTMYNVFKTPPDTEMSTHPSRDQRIENLQCEPYSETFRDATGKSFPLVVHPCGKPNQR